uniref:F-box protein n=1 Tax=Allium cepa TaxID=4679 RepID=C7E144_ALLCE|nr:F-box protein [Allium cepa]
MIFSILQLLPYDSILSFSMTCKRLRFLATSNSLWEYVCIRDWGAQSIDALISTSTLLNKDRSCISWIRVYKEICGVGSFSCDRLFSEDGMVPMARASHSLNFVSGCLVLFGGGCEGGRHLDDTWIALAKENQNNKRRRLIWKKMHANSPTGRFGHTCTTIDDSTLILFGGINDNGIRQNDLWVGHVSPQPNPTISWHALQNVGPCSPPPRGAHAACLSTTHLTLVIHGGISLSGLRLSDTWLLDLSNGPYSTSWCQFPNLDPSPPARSGHSLTWIGGTRHMVLFGGRGSGYEVLNDLWVFDLLGPKWTEIKYENSMTNMETPSPRVGHSANVMIGGKILIYGGEDSQRQRKDDLWILDVNALLSRYHNKATLKLLWKRVKVKNWAPGYRSFHGSCTDKFGRCLYVFGGMVDGVVQPGDAFGLRFDEELFVVELNLQL